MASSFGTRQLYGGAITVQLPSDYLDASDLRQVPDHQEVFLSPKTLTSVIFEINQYQSSSVISTDSNARAASSDSHPQNADEAAASYHFADPIQSPDHLSQTGITTERLVLASPSLSKYAAYASIGTIVSPEVDRSASSTLPLDWQSSPTIKKIDTKVQQLLVRMENVGTDFCVRVNVPLKEYQDDQQRINEEEQSADAIMKKIVETLDVKDFGLFGDQ